jgi:hypothetical protein
MDTANSWYLLKKEEKEPFGPVTLDQLKRWAQTAQISPMDLISRDGEVWIKAPMNPELEMDWLIQLSVDQFYGPTTIGAVNEFLDAGEIDVETLLVNCVTGEQHRIGDMDLEVVVEEEPPILDESGVSPERTAIGISTQDKAAALEQALIEERRELTALWERFNKLYRMYENEVGHPPEV